MLLFGISVAAALVMFIVAGVELDDTSGSLVEVNPVVGAEMLVPGLPLFATSVTGFDPGVG